MAITAATKPDQMDPVQTSITGDSKVQISWTPPDDRGASITSYSILIQSSVPGTFLADLTDCDGASAEVLANSFCEISLAYL